MLTLIPTPIGNLEDMTLRGLRLLREADAILAEDTRVTLKLLQHFEIQKTLWAYHAHNEHQLAPHLIELLHSGKKLVMVSDAGTPGISDAGFLLVRACLQAGIEVECLPGATAIMPALVVSGLPCDRFFFEGFLPHKKGRQTRLAFLQTLDYTFALYESPHRLIKTLQQLAEFCGAERQAVVVREISKMFEEKHRGTLAELVAFFQANEREKVRGEIVIAVAGRSKEAQKNAKKSRYQDRNENEEDENEDNDSNSNEE